MRTQYLLHCLLISALLFSVHPIKSHSPTINPIQIKPQSNTESESAVQTISKVQDDSDDSDEQSIVAKQSKKQTKQPKKKTQKDSSTISSQYTLKIQDKDRQYYVPISINEQKYSLGLSLESDSQSWVFSSKTDNHQQCDSDNNCDDSKVSLDCKDQKTCKQTKDSLQSSVKVVGDKSLILTFKNNDKEIVDKFLSASKVVLKDEYSDIDNFVGVKNLANATFLLSKQTIEIKQHINKDYTINVKQSSDMSLSFSSTQGKSDDEEEQEEDEDDKQEKINTFKTIRLSFDQKQIMSLPSSSYNQLVDLLKSAYLSNKCKLYSGHFKCSKAQEINKEDIIQMCINSRCFEVKLGSLLQKDEGKQKKISLLFTYNEDDELILSPGIGAIMSIGVEEGHVKGVIFNVSSKTGSQTSDSENSEESQQQSEQETAASNKKQKKNAQQSKNGKDKLTKQEAKPATNSFLFYFIVYGLVAFGVLIVIKMKAQQSAAASLLDDCLDATWYRIMDMIYGKKQGYNPTDQLERQDQQEEHIDRGNGVVVGYTQKQGRELFWQKNSVEGI